MRFLARDSLIHCKLIQFCTHTAGDLSQLLDPDMRLKFGEEVEDGGAAAKRAAANMRTTLVRVGLKLKNVAQFATKLCDQDGGGQDGGCQGVQVCRPVSVPFQKLSFDSCNADAAPDIETPCKLVQCCCPEIVQEAVRNARRPGKAPTLRLLLCELMHRHAMKHMKQMKHIHCDWRTCRAAVRERRFFCAAATVAQKPSSLTLCWLNLASMTSCIL